ncbi:rhodanese-like domain-containing protein [Gynurincola endophyticus]|uniref:rhodanese-like domain-containing protein n=1 Tax=Gynurincola endophyticus TaxID=2479004 RepID=UPI000F8E3466|nr:rhodanese-like domain-containing protein [Gynurincola endophyticus]
MENITVEELKARLDAGENVVLVDVREAGEHEEFNIGGVLHPLPKIMQMDIEAIENLKDGEVVLYCRSGNRSGQAAMMLETMGFSETKNLVGGMLKWRETFGG